MRAWVLALLLIAPASTSAGASTPAARNISVKVANLAELRRALDDARGHGSRRIELAAGTYELDQPIRIDARMSGTRARPLIVAAQPGAKVVLSGSRTLPALAWQALPGGLWRARVSGAPFQRLWLGSRALIRARYPNYDPAILPFGGVAADATAPSRIARWKHPAGGVLHALHGGRWGGVDFEILGKSSDGSLQLGPALGNNRDQPPSPDARFVENIVEELDGPDEWFDDHAAGWLYYKPAHGGRPPAAGFRASLLETIVRIEGGKTPVHDVRIEGIAFRETEPTFLKTTEPLLRSDWKFYRGGAVLIENAERVTIAKGSFTQLGGNAIVVSGHARAVTIRANLIADIGASAIAFVGRPEAVRSPLFNYGETLPLDAIDRTPGPRSEAYPADSVAEDNLIHDIGLVEKQAAGVEIAMSARITIDHNTIYRVPRAGINIGDGTWGGHLISNNDVFDTVRETGDHGAFNSWGRDRYWDPDRAEMDRRVAADRSLVNLDARETSILRHNRFRCDHGWDIDLDDGSSNYLIVDNLMLAGGLKLREGFDRVARNNIMVNNTLHPHVWFADSRDVFEHNIVMTGYQPIQIARWGARVDRNLFPLEADLKQAQTSGTDANSRFGRPDFVRPKTGDYSVSAKSPALTIGFRNFAMDDFGVRPAWLKALAERPDFPAPILQPNAGEREMPRSFAGMRIKSVETLGEQSAAGLPSKEGVMILAIEPGSASDRAGLKAGDVILSIIGGAVAPGQRTPTAAALVAAAQGRKWQTRIAVEVFRNQARQVVTLDIL